MNNNSKNFTDDMERMEMEHEIRQIREDLSGNVLQSANLLLAATEKKWDEVKNLLDENADPRICRLAFASGEIISALYMALQDKQFEIAGKLYDAGDRLDDFIGYSDNDGSCPDAAVTFLAGEMRLGRNYFLDESRSLSECCRCSAFRQIEKLMPEASQEELNKSIKTTVFAWRRNSGQTGLFLDILEGLKYYGAKLSEEDRAELQTLLEAIRKWPAVMQPANEDMQQIADFVENA